MTDSELAEVIKSEEHTRTSRQYEQQYKMRGETLTRLVNRHRPRLLERLRIRHRPQDALGSAPVSEPVTICGGVNGRDPGETRVLLIGLAPIQGLLLRLLLENLGHTVRQVDAGENAFDLVDVWEPSAIVIDPSTGESWGPQHWHKLQVRGRYSRVDVVVVGSAGEPIAGFDASFDNPFDAEHVASEIDRMLWASAETV